MTTADQPEPDHQSLTEVRDTGEVREPDLDARQRAAELDTGEQPDLRGDDDRDDDGEGSA